MSLCLCLNMINVMSNDCLICEPILLDPKLAYIERDYILLFYYTLFVESFDTSPYGQCLLQFSVLPICRHIIMPFADISSCHLDAGKRFDEHQRNTHQRPFIFQLVRNRSYRSGNSLRKKGHVQIIFHFSDKEEQTKQRLVFVT